MGNITSTASSCSGISFGERRWWVYLVTSMGLYILGLGLSSLAMGLKWFLHRRKELANICISNELHISNTFRDFFKQMLLGDSLPSKVYIGTNLICNMIYVCLGIIRTYYPACAEGPFDFGMHPQYIIEMIVGIELVIYAIVRYIASRNIVMYWFSPYTLVDVFTLPSVFLSAAMSIDWIGLRLLRFIWLTQIITVLRFFPFISHDAMSIISLIVYFLVTWMASSGIIQLLETQGDPWKYFQNGNGRSLFMYAYMIMATVSTVGYGDVAPVTVSGRIFITFFIIVGMAFFAAFLPRLIDITSGYYARSQYSYFDISHVPRHVIVCGHITAITAKDFLIDFLHPDRGDNKTHILFLHPAKPDTKLQYVLEQNNSRVQYLDGSALNCYDLQKAKIKESKAIFILANKHTFYPTEEDHSNLFRLVSIKNTTADVPVIVQLLHSFSKKQVFNIEGWSRFTDVALCLNELKLGLLSQSCLCPGFSTLIANLFYTSNFSSVCCDDESDVWKGMYIKGASKEIYSSPFSSYFYHKSFHQAAHTCYNVFSLILIAIENNQKLYINPSIDAIYINDNTIGYFIAENQDQIKVMESYNGRKQSIVKGSQSVASTSRFGKDYLNHRKDDLESIELLHSFYEQGKVTPIKPRTLLMDEDYFSDCCAAKEGRKCHITVSEPCRLEKAILNPDIAFEPTTRPNVDIRDHIILCLFADDNNTPLLGLHSFLKPLRSTRLPPELIKPVVIVSNKTFVEKEWAVIRNIPQVYLVVGDPLRWKNLKYAKISESSVCVILTVSAGSMDYEQEIIDKEAILCTLSIKNAKKLNKCHKDVRTITDLHKETNVQYLDINDKDEPDERIYKAQPFACGEAFSASVFDSVTSSAFHSSPGIIQLLESLIHVSQSNSLCRAIPIANSGFCNNTFVKFYNAQLRNNSICLGISRSLPQQDSKRCIITSPDPNLILAEGDFAYVITA